MSTTRILELVIVLTGVGFVLCLVCALLSCTPVTTPITPTIDSGDASPCELNQRITDARLIRTSDGAPLMLPGCDASH